MAQPPKEKRIEESLRLLPKDFYFIIQKLIKKETVGYQFTFIVYFLRNRGYDNPFIKGALQGKRYGYGYSFYQ